MLYAILHHPGHNRVYFESSLQLSISEFSIVSRKLSTACVNMQRLNICGIDYLSFETKQALAEADIDIVSSLSFLYALFQMDNFHGETYLKPIVIKREDFIDESISTILKYTGKTNELFTRMMINVAYYSQDRTGDIRLLDPIAGKGTTLYEGIIKGYNVYGIEIGDKIVNESYHYITNTSHMNMRSDL